MSRVAETRDERQVRARLTELRQARVALIREGRRINDGAKAKGRDLTADEARRFDLILAELRELAEEVRTGEELLITLDNAVRSAGRNEQWRARTFSRGFPEKPL